MEYIEEALDILLYSSYETNRDKAPHIPAEKWKSLFANQETYELIYKKRKNHEHRSNNK